MQAFRAPKPWDYTNGFGNPDLKPEKIYSLEAAGGWSFSPNLRFDLSAYHNRLSNLLTRVDEGDDWRWINAGAVTTDGCEAGLEYRRGRLKAYANYTYTESGGHAGRAGSGDRPPRRQRRDPCTPSPRACASASAGQYLGERKNTKIIPSTGNDRIDAAFVLHAALTLKLPRGIRSPARRQQPAGRRLLPSLQPSAQPLSVSRSARIRLSVGYAF